MLALKTEQPVLAISEQEGKDFMQAAQKVMKHYSVESTQKTLDWIAFIGCGAGMYVPRIAALSIGRKGQERTARAAPRQQAPNAAQQFQPTIVPDTYGNSGFSDTGG